MSCQCITLKGDVCKNSPLEGSFYCWRHQKCKNPVTNKSQKTPARALGEVKDLNDEKYILLRDIAQKRDTKTLKKGVLIVTAYANFFPVCYKDKGIIKGLDVEIMKEFVKFSGMKLLINEVKSFNGIWDLPAKGISDTSIGGIGISNQRTIKNTIWTIPYFKVQRTIVYNKQNPIKKFPADIKHDIRGTIGSTGYIDGMLRLKSIWTCL